MTCSDVIKTLLRDEFCVKYFGFVDCKREQFLQFQWSDNRVHFLLYRAFVFLYVFAWLITDVAINEDPYYIAYFTHWGEIVMFLYFASSFFITVSSFARTNATTASRAQIDDSPPLNSPPLRWYHVIIWGMLNIYSTVAVIITISYWVGVGEDLIEPTKSHPSVNVHVHVINFVLAFIESTLSDLPIRILHFYWPMLFGLVYVIFTLIVHWSGGPSAIYAIVDWSEQPRMAAGVAFGLVFTAVPVFHVIITFALYRTRIYFSKKLPSPAGTESPPTLKPLPIQSLGNNANRIAINLTEELTRL